MEENLQHFLENGPSSHRKRMRPWIKRCDKEAYRGFGVRKPVSDEVQKIAGELVSLINESNGGNWIWQQLLVLHGQLYDESVRFRK